MQLKSSFLTQVCASSLTVGKLNHIRKRETNGMKTQKNLTDLSLIVCCFTQKKLKYQLNIFIIFIIFFGFAVMQK